jgi:hypothetical protein
MLHHQLYHIFQFLRLSAVPLTREKVIAESDLNPTPSGDVAIVSRKIPFSLCFVDAFVYQVHSWSFEEGTNYAFYC